MFLVFDIETAFLYPWALALPRAVLLGRARRGRVRRRHLVLRARRDPGLHGHPGGRARLRVAQARRRVGVPMGSRFRDRPSSKTRSTGRASSRCSSTRSSPPAAAWSSCPSRRPSTTSRASAPSSRASRPRQADLLIIVGTITERQGPALRRIYEQMCEPKWVVAFGVCASTGGFYQNYSTMPGADQVDPGRRLHPRLPAAARTGARRPDPAAGAHPARRGPQPGRHRHREGREEGQEAGHRLRRARDRDPARGVEASKG